MDTPGHLRAFVERIERIETEIADLNGDKADIYKEAKGVGFDVAALREVIGRRRKRERNPDAFASTEATVELYLEALENSSPLVRAHERPPACTHEAGGDDAPPHDPDTGEILDTNTHPGASPSAQDGAEMVQGQNGSDDSAVRGPGEAAPAQSEQAVAASGAEEGLVGPSDPAPASEARPKSSAKPAAKKSSPSTPAVAGPSGIARRFAAAPASP